MEMNIELECPNCVGHVFHAIGEFVSRDEEMSEIIAVNVFEDDEEDDVIEVMVSWDFHPTPSQVALFREVWDEASRIPEVVIIHNAPTSITSYPVDRKHELN